MEGIKYATKALVHWKKLSVEDATWEEVKQLRHQFPSSNLEDNALLKGE
jgi:hypothetical protein